MKKLFIILLAIAAGTISAPAWAMSVDDILELCQAGFTPDRIAKIVEATGLDEPLEASDWARIKSEGCGVEVVDALLNVLVVSDAAIDVDGSEGYAESARDDVNVYLHTGWYGSYGSMFWGGYDPWWSASLAWYDPWWDWGWRYSYSHWYDPWWCYPNRARYYCHTWYSPYYYCGGNYTGGYYSGGVYERQKSARQGTAKSYRYASLKATPAAEKASFASAKAKPYRAGAIASGMNASGGVAYRKTTRTLVTTADGSAIIKRKTTTSARGSSNVTTGTVGHSKSSSGSTSTYAKRKTTVSNGQVSRGGTTTNVSRSKTSARSSTSTNSGKATIRRKAPSSGGATSTGNAARKQSVRSHAPSHSSAGARATSSGSSRAVATPKSSASGGARARGHR